MSYAGWDWSNGYMKDIHELRIKDEMNEMILTEEFFKLKKQSRTQSPRSPPSAVGRRQVELWGNGIVHPRNLG